MSSISTGMAGTRFKTESPAYGYSSHSSETAMASIPRTAAKAQRLFVRASHKADRREGALSVSTQVTEWLQALSGDDLLEAAELVAQADKDLSDQLYQDYLEVWDVLEEQDEAFAAEINGIDLWEGTTREGLQSQLDALGHAGAVSLEEANTAEFRITRTPWCWTTRG